MRNVYKGYQVGKLAIPKAHVASINTMYANTHGVGLRRPVVRPEKAITAKYAERPGKNAGIRGGRKV